MHTFYAYRHSLVYENIQNFILHLAEISLIYFSFLKNISLHEFKTASLFFVVIFAIRLFLNYQVFLITLWYFNGQ